MVVGAKARAAADVIGFGKGGAVRASLYEGQRHGAHAIQAYRGRGGLRGMVSVVDMRWRKQTQLTRQAHPSAKEDTGPACEREKAEEGRDGTVG